LSDRANTARTANEMLVTSSFPLIFGCRSTPQKPISWNGVSPPATWAASRGSLLMWITRTIAARTLIWLAAIAIPVQSVPAASCACTGGNACYSENEQTQGCCCSAEKVREGRCCCARRKAESRHSCCSNAKSSHDSGCKCGINCQCGKSQPPQPTAPPVERNSPTEKVVSDGALAVFIAGVVLPEVLPQRIDVSIELGTVTALDRCVSLCRFTL